MKMPIVFKFLFVTKCVHKICEQLFNKNDSWIYYDECIYKHGKYSDVNKKYFVFKCTFAHIRVHWRSTLQHCNVVATITFYRSFINKFQFSLQNVTKEAIVNRMFNNKLVPVPAIVVKSLQSLRTRKYSLVNQVSHLGKRFRKHVNGSIVKSRKEERTPKRGKR